jgi:hypothetical protein
MAFLFNSKDLIVGQLKLIHPEVNAARECHLRHGLSVFGHIVQKISEPFRVEDNDIDQEEFGKWQEKTDVVQDEKSDGNQYAVEDIHDPSPSML